MNLREKFRKRFTVGYESVDGTKLGDGLRYRKRKTADRQFVGLWRQGVNSLVLYGDDVHVVLREDGVEKRRVPCRLARN